MRILEINKLMAVAAVAFLATACGTSSVTGPDAANAGAESTVSALRFDPLPPTAPETPSTGTVPVIIKGDPGTIDVPTPDAVPAPRNRPAPQPDPGSEPAPSTGPAAPAVVGAPPVDPGPVPQPARCIAASFDIAQTVLFMGTPGVSLTATILDEKGNAIVDDSCEKLEWTVESTSPDAGPFGGPVVIDYGLDTRNVTLTGPAGIYKVGVMAINGAASSRLVTLQ